MRNLLRGSASKALFGFATLIATSTGALAASACPHGTIKYGVIPYDASAAFVPLYHQIAHIISEKMGCPVDLEIGTSYNATIEAMRSGKIDVAEFGPLSYVLANKIAGAEVVATYAAPDGKPDTYTASVVTWPGSGITTLKGVAGHTFAYSDPASTSGHLFPAYALKNVGIDPDHGVRAIYAGSHTASYEALLHHKVEAGEINSPEILSAQRAGIYKPSDFVTLWTSPPIPDDPITVRSNLPPAFKAKLTEVLQTLDLSSIPASELKITGLKGKGYVAIDDHAYDGIRSLVSVLHLDLAKMGS
ncbi:MAG TPA: phosphate/phosphite/phosphonate ABC transporter substrate-binding protein [Acidisoma sp.]|jgi:phosphonate transport system substrate-binding protein|uniref:phosphate/phosphite/phosphonate ABC transporter substrate-binding protein n=1 Tax=Acidisoma sp. TaxID=1872115 RepID=UPI002C29AEF4|nr:phosphate/phosphite/phosphonate ABC transporter substrate-binding protein [Acidisoma sp.]HTI02553.1 phosphate/phosphite/phosphonate ABC transporter substrate-binding protein [Acidisoma sp.]